MPNICEKSSHVQKEKMGSCKARFMSKQLIERVQLSFDQLYILMFV